MRVRKKPVEINAWRVKDIIELYQLMGDLPTPVAKAVADGIIFINHDHISVLTLEGTMRASNTDILIEGVKGEFYPCKSEIFYETYDVLTVTS